MRLFCSLCCLAVLLCLLPLRGQGREPGGQTGVKTTVLYVTGNTAHLDFPQAALTGQGVTVEVIRPDKLPVNAAALQRYACIVLSNVRASSFSLQQMNALQSACHDYGVGFGMVGGPNSFAAGGYRGTPIEAMLPVTMNLKAAQNLPPLGVVLIAEASEEPGQVKWHRDIGRAAADLLEPGDSFGVLDCEDNDFGNKHVPVDGVWHIALQSIGDYTALRRRIEGLPLEMGDPGSYVPFLKKAALELGKTEAKVRHIVLAGDGDTVFEEKPGQIQALLKRIHSEGVTVSVIACNATDKDSQSFLKTVAALGGGRLYIAKSREDFPTFLREDLSALAQPLMHREAFRVQAAGGPSLFTGITWADAPPLSGYNRSTAKPMAAVALASPQNDPIFVGWQYGAGRVWAFCAEAQPDRATAWIAWPGNRKFWGQVLDWTSHPMGTRNAVP